jgi:hypothetical protein
MSGLQWVWGVVQGDFNDNPTVGQVVANTVITSIPLLDQAGDARDLSANVKALAWDKRYNEYAVWLGFFFTLIGLIPGVGSLLKGVLKLVWQGAPIGRVLSFFNAHAKGNAVRWMKTLRAGQLNVYSQQAADSAKVLLDACIDNFKQAQVLIPSGMIDLQRQIQALVAVLQTVRTQVDAMFARITADLEGKLDQVLKQRVNNSVSGNSRSTLMLRQQADELSGAAEKRFRDMAEAIEQFDGGHSLARHGPDVSDADLQKRIRTGITPDQRFSPTDSSTRFRSYQDWVETRQRAIRDIQSQEKIKFGESMDVAPEPGMKQFYAIEIDHNRAIDEGFNGVGSPEKMPNPLKPKQKGKVYVESEPISGVTKTFTRINWKEDKKCWVVSQHYPVGRGWNEGSQRYENSI